MATFKNEKSTASSKPAEEPITEQEAPTEESKASAEDVSEVAMRINLLGKLVIPPSGP
jgi:hypothetical protein